VEVRWNEVEGENHYQVQSSTNDGASWSKQEDVPADHAYSAKLTVVPGQHYLFRVVAVNEYGVGTPSNEVEVITPDGKLPPPTNLRVVSNGPREVEVRWDEVSGEEKYVVQVSIDGGSSWDKQEDVPADHAYSAKLTVEPGRQYSFRVVAVNEFGASKPSNDIAVTTPDGRTSAPTYLRVVSVSPREIEVRWEEVAGEDIYRVLVSRDGGSSWSKQEDVPADHAYSAKLSVSPNQTYLFKVVAINAYGTSEASNVIQARSQGEPPTAPDNLRLVAKRTNEVEVKWSEVSGEDKYTVQVSTDNGKTWKKQEDVPADHAYSAKLTVTKGLTYWFRVIAVNEFGASLPSNVLKVVL
jgi:titin